MPDRPEAENLFLKHLAWIERAARAACTQDGVQGEESEVFVSQITMKLMENDYAVIRQHRGESTLRTYLTTIVGRQFVEFLRQRRGRWRESAAALRIGPPAPQLEKLVYRQGFSLRAAGEQLRTSKLTTMSDSELARLLETLPKREPLRPVQVPSDDVLDSTPGLSSADERIAEAESNADRARILDALKQVLGEMLPEDRLIAQMRFVDGFSVADIARTLETEQKPLYRRIERLLHKMRQGLETAGVRWTDVEGMIGEESGE